MLPFSTAQFFALFGAYNLAIWPAQIIAYVVGVLAIALIGRLEISSRIIAGILALGWLWTAVAYHWMFFATINPMGRIFAIGFAIEAGLIFAAGVLREQLVFRWTRSGAAMAGLLLIVYALLLYPAIGYWTGHVYPDAPSFGLTPCPLTIFTFGLLLLTIHGIPKLILVIPFMWSLVGGSAAFLLQIPQDWMLLAAGLVGTALIWGRDASDQKLREKTLPLPRG